MKVQKAFSIFTVVNLIWLLLASLHIDFQHYRNDFKVFQLTVSRSLFLLQVAIVLVLDVILQRNLFTLLSQMETIYKSTASKRKSFAISVLQALATISTLLMQLVDIYATGTGLLYSLNNRVNPNFFVCCMFSVFLVPPLALVYSSFFTLSVGHFVERKGYDCLAKFTLSNQWNTIHSILPLVEDSFFQHDEEMQNSTLMNETSLSSRGCLKVLYLLKQFRIQENKWFYSSLVIIISNLMFYFPFVLYFIKQDLKIHPEKYFLGFYFCCLILTPVVLNLMVQQKAYHFCIQTIKRTFKTSDSRKRKVLSNFVGITKDSFPDSFCFLFEFDADFCSTLIETVILIINTTLV